ncbi:MAG: hypothetical protein ACRET0_08805, partial [Steroidobacteraceae bacterium]
VLRVRSCTVVLWPIAQAVPVVRPPPRGARWRAAGIRLFTEPDSNPPLHIEVRVPRLHLVEQVCEIEQIAVGLPLCHLQHFALSAIWSSRMTVHREGPYARKMHARQPDGDRTIRWPLSGAVWCRADIRTARRPSGDGRTHWSANYRPDILAAAYDGRMRLL